MVAASKSDCIGGRTSLLSHLQEQFFTAAQRFTSSLRTCLPRTMVFSSNLTGLYSGLQPCFVAPTTATAPAKKTTGPFVAAAPAEGMSDTSVALVAGALSGIVADVITHPISRYF